MNEIVELKQRKNSIAPLEYGPVRSDTTILLWQENKSELPYHLTVETLSQEFQRLQNRTNENVDTFLVMNSRYEWNYSLVCINERELRKFSFSRPDSARVSTLDFRPLEGESISTWINNFARTTMASRIQRGSGSIIDRLRKFAGLKPGWDSYDAKRIEWATIIRAMNFFFKVLYNAGNKDIAAPFVAPLSDGGIQFEWKTCYKELILSIPEGEDEPLEYLKVDETLWEEKQQEDVAFSIDDMASIVTDWLV